MPKHCTAIHNTCETTAVESNKSVVGPHGFKLQELFLKRYFKQRIIQNQTKPQDDGRRMEAFTYIYISKKRHCGLIISSAPSVTKIEASQCEHRMGSLGSTLRFNEVRDNTCKVNWEPVSSL